MGVTPGVGHASAADGLTLRQPAGGAAAESPTQTKLRSLLKVGKGVAMPEAKFALLHESIFEDCYLLQSRLASGFSCTALPDAGAQSPHTVCMGAV